MESSPFPDDAKPVQLRVETGSPLAEVFLIDHAFVLVDRKLGVLDRAVEQGVYKVKAQLGDASAEKLVVADRDLTIDLSRELSIASPVPLVGTSRTHEFHMESAATESGSVSLSVGSGAQVFLCSRRWTGSTGPAPDKRPPPGLRLLTADGATIFDVRESGRRHEDESDPMASATVEVDPGSYFLRWQDDEGVAAEQSLLAVRDWQSQVFLLNDARDADNPRLGISVLMARHSFSADDPRLRQADEARVALADERRVATKDINETLFAKFEYPMLGLFGAHLMLIAQEASRKAEEETSRRTSGVPRRRAAVDFDQALFDDVVANLVSLLGREHPDVAALATRASNQSRDDLGPVTVPPMLWRSWLLLIEASNEWPGLLPVATWRRALKVLPLRPFLVWSAEDDQEQTMERWQRGVAAAVRASVAGAASSSPRGAAADVPPAAQPDEVRRRLTEQLLAPRAAIDELADSRGADAPG